MRERIQLICEHTADYVHKSTTKHAYALSIQEVWKKQAVLFSLDSKEDDAWVRTNHLYKRMIQIGQPRSSGHVKQNTPHLLCIEWTIYVLHCAGHIPLFAGLVCRCAYMYFMCICTYLSLQRWIGGTVPKFLHCYGGLITLTWNGLWQMILWNLIMYSGFVRIIPTYCTESEQILTLFTHRNARKHAHTANANMDFV